MLIIFQGMFFCVFAVKVAGAGTMHTKSSLFVDHFGIFSSQNGVVKVEFFLHAFDNLKSIESENDNYRKQKYPQSSQKQYQKVENPTHLQKTQPQIWGMSKDIRKLIIYELSTSVSISRLTLSPPFALTASVFFG